MADKNFYEILGVTESASQDEIKRAYKKLAKEFHPDKNRGNKKAEERFKQISEAHSILGDAEKRRKYDQLRKMGGAPFAGGGGAVDWEEILRQFDMFNASQGGTRSSGFHSFGGGFDLGSMFEEMMGGAGSQARRGRSAAESEVHVPFRTAIKGGNIDVELNEPGACPDCRGTGAAPGSRPHKCLVCDGTGTVQDRRGPITMQHTCSACGGRGSTSDSACPRCHGTGEASSRQRVTVRIPAGIEDGTIIRLSARPGHGLGSDLVLRVRVKPDKLFSREGQNIKLTLPINLAQALLGSKVKIPTPEGKSILLRIPPGTQNGHVFRMRGLGVHGHGAPGDMLVNIKVTLPTDLSESDKELVRKLARSTGMKF